MASEARKEIDCTPNHMDGLKAMKEDKSPEDVARERSMLSAAQNNFSMFRLVGKDRNEKVAMAENTFTCKQKPE